MCWFHVRYNIPKQEKIKIPEDKINKTIKTLKSLHKTPCNGEFKLMWRKVKAAWTLDVTMHKFLKYFERQWINSPFHNWQIFNQPAGYAGTSTVYTIRQLQRN